MGLVLLAGCLWDGPSQETACARKPPYHWAGFDTEPAPGNPGNLTRFAMYPDSNLAKGRILGWGNCDPDRTRIDWTVRDQTGTEVFKHHGLSFDLSLDAAQLLLVDVRGTTPRGETIFEQTGMVVQLDLFMSVEGPTFIERETDLVLPMHWHPDMLVVRRDGLGGVPTDIALLDNEGTEIAHDSGSLVLDSNCNDGGGPDFPWPEPERWPLTLRLTNTALVPSDQSGSTFVIQTRYAYACALDAEAR